MKKNTNLSRLKIRWLNTQSLILMLFTFLFSIFGGNAQTYCVPQYSSGCTSGDNLNSFILTGHGASVLSDLNSGCNHTDGTGYSNRTSLFAPVDLLPGASYTVEMNTTYSSPQYELASIWIDLNSDGTFDDTTEKLLNELVMVQNPAFATGSISIPLSTSPGIYRMRVRLVYGTAGGFDACSSSSWGETHDYNVNILSLTPCSGTVVAGTAISTLTDACPGESFTLALSGSTVGGGITYQWQSLPAGAGTFTDIPGAIYANHNVTGQTVSTDYRCIVTCTNSNSTDTSTVVTVGHLPITECYCTPTYTYACTNTSENINSFILIGEGTSAINDLDTGCSPGNYQDSTSVLNPVDLLQDGAYTVQFNTNYGSGSFVYATIWIDFDDNGVFDASEKLLADVPMVTTPALATVTLNIPATASPGIHRMRVRSVYSSTNIDPCSSLSWGEAHDYLVNIIPVTCYRGSIASITKASATSVDVSITPSALNTGAVDYEYEVRTSGLPGSGGPGLVTSGTSPLPDFTVGGLQAGVIYTIYVRTDCGSNDYSGYSSYEFGIPASIPYTQDFEGAQHGWVLSNGGSVNEWVVGNAVSNGGARSLYISNDQGISNAYTISTTTVVHAYKDFELLPSVSDISIAFDWRALAESCCDYIRVWLVPSSFTPTVGTQIGTATGRVNLTGNLNMDAAFKRFQQIQNASAYTGSFRIVFEWRNDGSVGTMPAAAIDNIEIKPVTCYQPTNMVLSVIKHNGVTVTLTPDSKNTGSVSYEYEVRTSGTPGSGPIGRVATGTSTTPVFNITGLPDDTSFDIYVRTSCGSNDASFWRSSSFKTLEIMEIDITKVDITCFGEDNGSITITTTGGKLPYTYTWTPAVTTSNTASDLAPGIYNITVEDDSGQVINSSITILEPTPIVSGLDYTDVVCNGQNNGTASVTPTGGTPPYTVLWSDSTIGLTNSNLAPGSYDVTIRDANHCVLTESFTIDEPDVLVASVGNQTDVSTYGGNDGSATVAVTGGTSPYTYTWTPAVSTTDTASALTAGTYTVVVTDANGCTSTQVFVITEPAPPYVITLVSQTDVSCNGGNDGSITISVTGPNPPFTYSWSPSGGSGTTASNLTAGTYTVAVTDAVNEVITEDFTITEPEGMNVSVGSVVNVSCNGNNDGSATVSVLGGITPYNYTWSNGETTATAVSLTAGNHYVLVTDANGCQVQQSFSIGQPTPIIINAVNITGASCNGQADGAITISVNGGLTPYTYSWSNNQTGTSLSNLAGGAYTVTVTDANGCTATKSFTVIDPAVVYPPSAVNQGLCSDNNPLLSDVVITGTNIQWYDAATGGNLLPMTTALTNGTTYYASQTVNGCESASRTAVQISLFQSVPLTTTNKSVCYNSIIQDVTIDGFNYMQLKWYSSATSPVALPATTLLASGTYYVSSFTNGVCESARQVVQVTVSQGIPAPVVTPQQVCGSGNTLDDLTVGTVAGATLIWYASAQATTPLPGTTQALSGTYYVEQTIGTCKSVRVAVPVQIIPVTSPAMTDLTTCSGTTIADFNAQVAPTKYVWYINNTTTTPLAETTLISSGTFYIAEEVSGCISNRAQVDVVVNQRPNKPTGQTVQRVDPGSTVADLQMNQPGVVWFGSEADALVFTKQLPSNTPLVHNKKYYAVLVGGNNCASLPTEVEVIIVLSTNNLDLTYLKYYPNPTDAELNISYVEAITKVEIFNIAGQKVLSKEFDANEVKVDLSGFGAGTYMVRIETETASQFVKVVKK